MRHSKFIVAATCVMLAVVAVVTGLAFYSKYDSPAPLPGLPNALRYLPASAHSVIGINVHKFLQSPLYKRMEQKSEGKIEQALNEIIQNTGLDPRTDLQYIVMAGPMEKSFKNTGVVIAIGRFDSAKITRFLKTKKPLIELPYRTSRIYRVAEPGGNQTEKGMAFLSESEIALADIETLKKVLDVQAQAAAGIESSPLGQIIRTLNPEEMFWFVGDYSSLMAQIPNNPLGNQLSSIQTVYGTLDMTDAIRGRIVATATSKENADKLKQFLQGMVALGQLAGASQNAEIAALMNQIKIDVASEDVRVILNMNIPYDLLDKLETLKNSRNAQGSGGTAGFSPAVHSPKRRF